MYNMKNLSMPTTAIKILPTLFMMLSGLALSGCIATSRTPATPIVPYVTPPIATQTATLVGAQTEVKIYDDITAYVFAVDQQKVMIGREGWNTPLTLNAGQHDIQVICQQGGFVYSNLITLDAQANKQYQIGYSYNHDNRRNCDFWITDFSTQKPVTTLVNGVELWRANPRKMRPLDRVLEPRPTQSAPSYVVPIRVVNKMGS